MIKFSTNFENFKNGLKQVLGATDDDKNIAIGNVLLKLFDDKVELVATDGNRIRLKRLALDEKINIQEPIKTLINVDMLYNQIKNFKVTDKTLNKITSAFFELDADEKSFIFACPIVGLQKISITVLENNYPSYEQLIQNYNHVEMDCMTDMLQSDKETFKIAFTAKHLLDYLKNVDKNSVVAFEVAHNLGMVNVYSCNDSTLFEGLMPAQIKDVTTSQKWGQ